MREMIGKLFLDERTSEIVGLGRYVCPGYVENVASLKVDLLARSDEPGLLRGMLHEHATRHLEDTMCERAHLER